MNQRIVCAAIKLGDTIICSPRHFDSVCVSTLDDMHVHESNWGLYEQGFVDQSGKFFNRQEAFKIALAVGQVNESENDCLISEDLY